MRSFFLFLVLVSSGAYIEFTADKDDRSNIKSGTAAMKGTEATSPEDREHMARAFDLSFHGLEHEDGGPFGSVVVKDGVVIGEGWNQVKRLSDPSAHAEVMAIRDACSRNPIDNLKGSIIYASAQPCPMCLSLIYLTGIEKVYYCIPGEAIAEVDPALSVRHVYEALRSPRHERPLTEEAIMQEEVSGMLDAYRKFDW